VTNSPIDPIKNDLERVAQNAFNRTEVGKTTASLQREARQAKGMFARLIGIFRKK
jgi:hypothetical protein